MANIVVTECVGIHNPNGQITQAASITGTGEVHQVVAIGGTTAATSNALNANTTLIRVFAEAACYISVKASPNAETDTSLWPLDAGGEIWFNVPLSSGFKVACVSRTVS